MKTKALVPSISFAQKSTLSCEVGAMNHWWLKLIRGSFSSSVDSSLFLYCLLPCIVTFRCHLFSSFYSSLASNIEQISHSRFCVLFLLRVRGLSGGFLACQCFGGFLCVCLWFIYLFIFLFLFLFFLLNNSSTEQIVCDYFNILQQLVLTNIHRLVLNK